MTDPQPTPYTAPPVTFPPAIHPGMEQQVEPYPQQYPTPYPAAPPAVVYIQGPPAAPVGPMKDVGVAYLFWFFLGIVGGHQFYLGKTGRGVLYLCTFGVLGIGVLLDLFTLPSQVRAANTQRALGIR